MSPDASPGTTAPDDYAGNDALERMRDALAGVMESQRQGGPV